MSAKFLLNVLVIILWLAVASGCRLGSHEKSELGEEPNEISGIYSLVSVNGSAVPAKVSHGGDIWVHSGEFIIRPDGTCLSSSLFSPPTGGEVTRKVSASYTINGAQLIMKWKGAGTTTGHIKNDLFTMDNHGMVFVYKRSAREDDYSKLDETGYEEDPVRVRKAEKGVFDDFNSGLVNGWDSAGNRIGFITFSDSEASSVAISTTFSYPELPSVSQRSEVLALEMDVKNWAGIIHNFENYNVDTWTPRDWREFKAIRFWIYGRNSNTGLFFEILDNRGSNSNSGTAEIFNYSFSDNFLGWRQMTIAFEEFNRKEIGNGAPNDGLGLSEVHGWAFGVLNTNGPVTYYIENIELR